MVILDIDGQKYAGQSYVSEDSAAAYALAVEKLAEEIAETVLLHYGLTAAHIRIEAKEIEYAIIGEEEFAEAYLPAVSVEDIRETASLAERLGIPKALSESFQRSLDKFKEKK